MAERGGIVRVIENKGCVHILTSRTYNPPVYSDTMPVMLPGRGVNRRLPVGFIDSIGIGLAEWLQMSLRFIRNVVYWLFVCVCVRLPVCPSRSCPLFFFLVVVVVVVSLALVLVHVLIDAVVRVLGRVLVSVFPRPATRSWLGLSSQRRPW